MPIGIPGWPELAACTPSAANMRIVLAASFSKVLSKGFSNSGIDFVCAVIWHKSFRSKVWKGF
jgi:hypothetical protein